MLPEIRALGADLVAISPQLPEHSRELIERRHLTFEILSDRGNEVAARFGLRFTLPDYLQRIYRTFPSISRRSTGTRRGRSRCPAGS